MGICESKPQTTSGAGTDRGKSGRLYDTLASVNPSVAAKNLFQKNTTTSPSKKGAAAGGGAHHLRNVFAMPLELVDAATYKPPDFPKTNEEKEFIRNALKKNFVFENLSSDELHQLVNAFEKITQGQDEVIIKQGDPGDYFYVILEGTCSFSVNDKRVGTVGSKGHSFGELALLYTCPRAATVIALEPMTLFRVDQKTFRYILQAQTQQGEKAKKDLLKGVSFLQDLSEADMQKMVDVMVPHPFGKDEKIVTKGEIGDAFYVIEEGELVATDLGEGDTKYEDVNLGPGDHFGERALATKGPRMGTIIAKTKGRAFAIDKDTFESILGDFNELVLKSLDKTMLGAIKVLKESQLDSATLSSLAKLVVDRNFKAGQAIIEESEQTEAAVYLIRKGSVDLSTQSGSRKEKHSQGGFFGDDMLLADVNAGSNSRDQPTTIMANYTVKATEDTRCGVLYLKDCRKVLDTLYIGKSDKARFDSIVEMKDITLDSLQRHKILGAGTFGQVWLVSREDAKKEKRAYALKVQSKYELVQDGQAKAVVYEKNIMAKMHHPFIAMLVAAFQDEQFVYMLMNLIQGGELFSVIHDSRHHHLSENDAMFYTAGIAEGIGYMHRRGFVYRDLKPENVLISNEGYPVIVDFGFAKYVTDKTYTLCGTPLYLPPEVILNRGHNWAADHWSLGVMAYEMLTGYTPFYEDGMDQMELFRTIVKGKYEMPRRISDAAASLLRGFLTRDPAKRLGSLAGGEDDVLEHPWFASLDFDKLRQMEVKVPYVPKIKNPLDGSNFGDWTHLDDKLKTKYPPLKPADAKIFESY